MEATMSRTSTAHEAWDELWADEATAAGWLTPDPWITAIAPLLAARDAVDVLDVGCGVGRHALFFAQQGFRARGIDGSAAGIERARRAAAAAGADVDYRVAEFTALPFPDAAFDHVVAWHTLYHGDRDSVRLALAEVARVLRPGGLLQCSMLSKRHRLFGRGDEVSPDTFVIAGAGERAHPHFYCDARGLAELLAGAGFEPLHLRDTDEEDGPQTWHWHVTAEKQSVG
jgi:SAM-dependent methyltransferase